MLSMLKMHFKTDVYTVMGDGRVERCNEDLFSKKNILEKLGQNDERFFKAFLETGYEKQAVYLNQKKQLIKTDLKAIELQMKSLALLQNRLEKCVIKKQTECSDRTKTKIDKYINEAKVNYLKLLEAELENGEVFYNGNFVNHYGSLKNQYKRDKQAMFGEILDELYPAQGESLTSVLQQVKESLNRVKSEEQVILNVLKNVKKKLAKLEEHFQKVMQERRNMATVMLKNQSYSSYHQFCKAILEAEPQQYISIPTTLCLSEENDTLLHTALADDIQHSPLVRLIVARGGDPLLENKVGNTPLDLAAMAYAKTTCKKDDYTAEDFKVMVNAFNLDIPVILYNYVSLNILNEVDNIEPLFEEVRVCLHGQVKDFYDCCDLDLSRVTKTALAVERNLPARVRKFIIMHQGFLTSLENLSVEPLFLAIDRAALRLCKNSDNFFSNGENLHLDSRIISRMIKIKRDYLTNPDKKEEKPLSCARLLGITTLTKTSTEKRESIALSCALAAQQKSHEHALAQKDQFAVQQKLAFEQKLKETQQEHNKTVQCLQEQNERKSEEIDKLQKEAERTLAGNVKLSKLTTRLLAKNKKLEAILASIEDEYESSDGNNDSERDNNQEAQPSNDKSRRTSLG